jgi:hypothetical protein
MNSSGNGRARGAPIVLLIAGVLGGGLAWMLVQKSEGYFKPAADVMRNTGQAISPEAMKLMEAEKLRTDCKNATLAAGLFGIVVGGMLGVGSGISQRSVRAAGLALLTGALFGGTLAAIGGYLEVVANARLGQDQSLDKTLKAMTVHSIAWMLAGGGIALGVSLPRWRGGLLIRCVGAGIAAGVIAGLLYSPLAAMLFPTERSEQPLPTGAWNRLFWISLPAGLMGLAIGRASSERSPPQPEDEAPVVADL